MRVVITDCKYKMSLAPLWELREAGYEAVCGEYDDVPDKHLLGSRSRSHSSFASGSAPLSSGRPVRS